MLSIFSLLSPFLAVVVFFVGVICKTQQQSPQKQSTIDGNSKISKTLVALKRTEKTTKHSVYTQFRINHDIRYKGSVQSILRMEEHKTIYQQLLGIGHCDSEHRNPT